MSNDLGKARNPAPQRDPRRFPTELRSVGASPAGDPARPKTSDAGPSFATVPVAVRAGAKVTVGLAFIHELPGAVAVA